MVSVANFLPHKNILESFQPIGINSEDHSPCRDGTDGLLIDGDQLVQHYVSTGEDAVWVEEGVQEVDGEEAQVSQPLQ